MFGQFLSTLWQCFPGEHSSVAGNVCWSFPLLLYSGLNLLLRVTRYQRGRYLYGAPAEWARRPASSLPPADKGHLLRLQLTQLLLCVVPVREPVTQPLPMQISKAPGALLECTHF